MTRRTHTIGTTNNAISCRLFLSLMLCLAFGGPLSACAENNVPDERFPEMSLDDTTPKNQDQELDQPDFGRDGTPDWEGEQGFDQDAPEDADALSGQPPSRAEVEEYRSRLEMRLLERYNNMPDHAGNVGRVTVALSKPLQTSLDGTMIRAEFDQLVFDPWGRRIPELEEEYYVVTFGSGGARQVRADPSIRVGLNLEKTWSERAPLAADPFSRVPEDRAFHPAPKPERARQEPQTAVPRVRMPEWWRPDFPELQ